MSQWVNLALVCDADDCGAEFPGRVGERLAATRRRAADLGWGSGPHNDDRCPVHAVVEAPRRLAVIR
ncbi:hypothetical protein [Pseudonocardia sp. D17]|uniref:hypothetical protein n=1 Tax=Pseudonocardia sp. D17 TaxID=882661 RepID=UPI002B3EECA7|nr:hypothetical protein PSD17_56470 [Pseudonocardia sp. D17]